MYPAPAIERKQTMEKEQSLTNVKLEAMENPSEHQMKL
jgi:hypothetical protein